MGLFDSVRSLFGSEKSDASEDDASGADAPEREQAEPSETEPSEADSEPTDTPPADPASESPAAAVSPEPDTEPTAADEAAAGESDTAAGEAAAGESGGAVSESAESSTDPFEHDEEPISWDETGFEQLATELVDEEADDEPSDAADFIQEAEPDRADEPTEPPTATQSDAETPSGTEPSTEIDTASAGAEQDTDAAGTQDTDERTVGPDSEQHLPLDEGVTADDSAAGAGIDVPEDSQRAEFLEDATDLSEFWSEYDLTFTVASLARLDELLGEQYGHERFEDAEYGAEDYDSQVFTSLVDQAGAYVGEVFVRHHDGEWVQEDDRWLVDVPAGPAVEPAGATVSVFHIAREALTGPSTVSGEHDAIAARLGLAETVGSEATTTVEAADGDTDAATRLRESAEDLAERWPEYELDFSTASLERLQDLIAAELDAERFEGAELGDETDQASMLLTAHAVGVGGYLGEVLRREHGGEWTDDGLVVLDGREVDAIDFAVDCVRGEATLADAVPDA